MNLLHLTYAVEVARLGSIRKAADALFIAQPNLSRAIKELEADLGIPIFNRSFKGMEPTPDGEEFIGYAKRILSQIDEVEHLYRDKGKRPAPQKFSISVPRASYIAHAFARFSRMINADTAEIYYNETNSSHTISNVLSGEYNLGIVRYAKKFDVYFKNMFLEKELLNQVIRNFHYVLIMHGQSSLASQKVIHLADLNPYIEIAHADPFVPSLIFSTIKREELPDTIKRRIFVFERGSQFELLSHNQKTFMWVSPVPGELLGRYGLVQRECVDNTKEYEDVLIYRKGYHLSKLDRQFFSVLGQVNDPPLEE